MRQYITTAIDYPNAPPHMGHVLEKVLADVCARWMRLRGDPVHFQIGTDEHGSKIQRTAKMRGLTPQQLVDQNVMLFEDLYGKLHISYDDFIRTTDQQRHWPTVVELWKRLEQAGMLQKRTYTGLYCSGCEKFLTKKDLVDGVCPSHQQAPEEVCEENYFFLLSKETLWLRDLLTKEKGGYRIVPQFRERETLSLLDQGLEDVSFSRPRSSVSWGIPVPGDESQTMYVWCDALTNYISTLDIFHLAHGTDRGELFWNQAEVTHVIGKDIARFHALLWPAMLRHAGVRTPDRLLIHGFITSEGQKMSKTIGNVVEPSEVLGKYGVDPLRLYLSREIPVGSDGDFSWGRFRDFYNAELRNKLGNLLNRVLVLLWKEGGSLTVPRHSSARIFDVAKTWEGYQECMNRFEVHNALAFTWPLVVNANVMIDRERLWERKGEEKMSLLGELVECLRHTSLMLLPCIPETAQKIATQLGLSYAPRMLAKDFVVTAKMREWGGEMEWKRVGEPLILFPEASTLREPQGRLGSA